jgi:hypothetical protein
MAKSPLGPSYCTICSEYFWESKHECEWGVEKFTDSDGHQSLRIIATTSEEQNTARILLEEFERTMNLLKANNGKGSMTEAMWLLLEDAYYGGVQCNWPKWKKYLKSLKGQTNE